MRLSKRDLYLRKKLRTLGQPTVLALIVTIGILNVCLGFGLAMYFGYGPPGLDGILQAIGPMPPQRPLRASPTPVGLGALYIPGGDNAMQQSAANLAAQEGIEPAESLSEEGVLSDVRELTAAAQTATASDTAQARP